LLHLLTRETQTKWLRSIKEKLSINLSKKLTSD
jgi:hypothetical protein